MTLYRRRSVIVEAFQWQPDVVTMEGKHPIPNWLMPNCVVTGTKLEVFTLMGMITCFAGDWIVQEGKNLRILVPDSFEAMYEAVG